MMARILNGSLLLLSLLLALLLAACGSSGMKLPTATPMPIVIECAGDPTCVNAFALLELWGLTSLGEIQRQVVRLPDSLRIVEGEPPWGIRDALSTDVGLSLEPYLSQDVTLMRFRVAREDVVDLRDELASMADAEFAATVVLHQDEPIGGWLYALEATGVGWSLRGRTLEEVTGYPNYPSWLAQHQAAWPVESQDAASRTPTPTSVPSVVPSDCAGFGRPALVLIPSPAQRTDPASFTLTSPDGDARCTLTPAGVPWSSERCQVVGEHIYYRSDITAAEATHVLDARSGTLERLDFTRAPGYQYGDFLVSPGGDRIAWSVGQTGVGTSRSTLFLARVDGSEQRKVLDEHYDDLYHILLVAWTPAGDALFFARRWLVVEGNGGVLPTFQGRYGNLYRLDVETGEVSTVIPLDERPDCWFCVADVSPDGRWVAYHHDDEDGTLVSSQ